MKKTMNRRYLDLAIGILAALAGFMLAGCDGTSPSGQDNSDPCSSPAAIHLTSQAQHFASAAAESQYIVGQARQLCVGWSASHYFSDCSTMLVKQYGMSQSQATAECNTSMTASQCEDWEHDYVDSAGVRHMYSVVQGCQGQCLNLGGFYIMSDNTTSGSPICTVVGDGDTCISGCQS